MKKVLISFVSAIVLLALAFSLASCGLGITNGGSTEGDIVDGGSGVRPAYDIAGGGGISRSDGFDSSYYSSVKEGVYGEGEPSDYEYPETDPSAGMMTAKAWNDNDYYEQWKKLFIQSTDNDPEGKFFD